MNNKILFYAIVAFCIFSSQINAQLKVDSVGRVKMSKIVAINGANFTDTIALKIKTHSVSSNTHKYGVFSYVPGSMEFSGCGVAMVGQANGTILPFGSRKPFMAGVAGIAGPYSIGIYGTTEEVLPTTWPDGAYAGYFNGNIKVTGNVTATSVTTTSDSRLKDNISELEDVFVMDILSRLKPISFTFRKDSSLYRPFEDQSSIHYGFIAQEVQEILPELVHEDGTGLLSLNYTELIPLLVNALCSQHRQIEALQSVLIDSVSTIILRGNSNKHSVTESAVLFQNNPNPFTSDTEIQFQLPLTTKSATLYVYNMNGLQVAEYPISSFGNGSIIVTARQLEAGMYLYSLIADGREIDTKRMILTK